MDENNEQQITNSTPEGNGGEGRTFTQEDVNRIVQDRLARSRPDKELQQREAELTKRELMLDAREALAEAGLPKELLTAINLSDKETMLASITAIQSAVKGSNQPAPKTPQIVAPSSGNAGGGDAIRRAMGLR